MSDLYRARLALTYMPDTMDEITLIRPHDLLTGTPSREWELQTANHSLLGRAWGEDRALGSARLTWSAEVCVRARTVGRLTARLRALELDLNTHRQGSVMLWEGWHDGRPMIETSWRCLVAAATVRGLTMEEAPPMPGAWGALALSLTLTNPSTDHA